jgi:hypothetical protein
VHCDHEFPLHGFVVNTKEKEAFLSNYMNGIVSNYGNSFGLKRR